MLLLPSTRLRLCVGLKEVVTRLWPANFKEVARQEETYACGLLRCDAKKVCQKKKLLFKSTKTSS